MGRADSSDAGMVKWEVDRAMIYLEYSSMTGGGGRGR